MNNVPFDLLGKSPCKYHIAFTGSLTAGKSTSAQAAQFLLSPFYKVHVCHFAYDLKKIATEHFGWDGKKDDKGRRLLQAIGQEVGRDYDPWIWVRKSLERERELFGARIGQEDCIAIYDDLRYDNEAAWIKDVTADCAGLIIYVSDNIEKDASVLNHESERGLSFHKANYRIHNNYNAVALVNAIWAMLNSYGFHTLRRDIETSPIENVLKDKCPYHFVVYGRLYAWVTSPHFMADEVTICPHCKFILSNKKE
jgi:hypothetical protein